jgi:hypothetical protein
VLESFEQRLLQNVFRIFPISQNSIYVELNLLGVTPAQLNEGRTISGPRCQNQKFVSRLPYIAFKFSGEAY